MSQPQDYLKPVIIFISIEIGLSVVNVLFNFTENFPHTAARYRHWLYLISDDNLDHWNLHQLLLTALLPAYMIFFWQGLEIRHPGSWPPRPPNRTFDSIKRAVGCSFIASKCYSIFVILYIVWSVPPGGSKLMTWIDLWLESTLTALVSMSLCWIPWCLSSLAFGLEEFIADFLDLFYPPRLAEN